jgi:hypothetical protein
VQSNFIVVEERFLETLREQAGSGNGSDSRTKKQRDEIQTENDGRRSRRHERGGKRAEASGHGLRRKGEDADEEETAEGPAQAQLLKDDGKKKRKKIKSAKVLADDDPQLLDGPNKIQLAPLA